ncbi:MAG: class I SAM-dependent methyltransferase [Clostridiales bacterium]|nr:class I SAM-dependent methyltransferase [Clostridiales bacterium]
MSELGIVEDTLFISMIGRIYASEHCQKILYDEKALSLKENLPIGLMEREMKGQSEYTLLASASRSVNMDRVLRDFLKRKPNGVVAQLGCGLETTFYRCDNGITCWYGVDLPNVIEYRKSLMPESEREKYIAGDAFDSAWLKQVRDEAPDAPILITASGLFYYFEEDKVLALMRMLQNNGAIEIVFGTVNKSGMIMMRKQYMKQVGHEDAAMFFYVDSAEELAAKIGSDVNVLAEGKYYSHIDKSGIKFSTKLTMIGSDLMKMVKMIHLELHYYSGK